MELIAEKGFIAYEGGKTKVLNNHMVTVSYSHLD